MKNNNYSRAKQLGEYILTNHSTIRKTALVFGISKSTVHLEVSHKLRLVDYNLYKKVKTILDKNFLERNIRGGMATKQKYENLKKCLV